MSDELRLPEEQVRRIINSLLDIGLFDREMVKSAGILTSRGVQERYQVIKADDDGEADGEDPEVLTDLFGFEDV